MSVSIKSCPNRCSDHGTCMYGTEARGLTSYSYCYSDRDHGGFDCSVDLSQKWHSFSLIATNAVAILPAFRALYQKECPEWIVFLSSGISSALYYACDERTYCILHFSVLQLMDFWLSFLAVVSTFVYLTNVNEATKRTIHTVATITTALMAVTGPTRSINIPIVLSLGVARLLIGWLIEFCTQIKSLSVPSRTWLQFPERWENVKIWFLNLVETIYKYFNWVFVILGFIALAIAAVSREMRDPETYWIWHSSWHVCMYTCALFFLCSKANRRNGDNEKAASYQLAETQEGNSKDDEDPEHKNGEAGENKLGQS